MLKFMVFLTAAIIVYAAYVFIGRACVDLIHNGRIAEGVVLIVITGLLFIMISWSYYKVRNYPLINGIA
jgi:palmitoyltransferase